MCMDVRDCIGQKIDASDLTRWDALTMMLARCRLLMRRARIRRSSFGRENKVRIRTMHTTRIGIKITRRTRTLIAMVGKSTEKLLALVQMKMEKSPWCY